MAQLQLRKEAEVANLKYEIFSTSLRDEQGIEDDKSGKLYTGPQKYAHRKSSISLTAKRPTNSATKYDPPTISGCFNCTEKGNLLINCENAFNIALVAANKFEYYSMKKIFSRKSLNMY